MKKSIFCLNILLIFITVSCFVEKTNTLETKTSFETSAPNSFEIAAPKPETYRNENLIWQGESGDYQIYWTEKDIYVEKDGQSKKLFTDFTKKYYDINFKYETVYSEKLDKIVKTKELNSCLISIDGQIISAVGNYLTLEIEEFFLCGIVQYNTHWIVFDLENLDKIKFSINTAGNYAAQVGVKITDIFDDKQILKELLKNIEIKKSIEAIKKDFEPKSTLELLQWFQDKEKQYRNNFDTENKTFAFEDIAFENLNYSLLNKRALTEFNFYRIEADKVIVQIALEPHFKQHGLRFIEIELEIPDKLKQQFEQSKLKQKGFLGRELFKNENSKISFENGEDLN